MVDHSNEQGDYKSPPASVDNHNDSWGPFSKHKIPLDEYHTCPCCNGKGYVGIVKESIPNGPRRKRRDILGHSID